MVNWHSFIFLQNWNRIVTIKVVMYDALFLMIAFIVMYSECLEVKHQCFQCKVVQTNRTLQVAVVIFD